MYICLWDQSVLHCYGLYVGKMLISKDHTDPRSEHKRSLAFYTQEEKLIPFQSFQEHRNRPNEANNKWHFL